MQGLMQDYPLILDMAFNRAEQLWSAKRLATATGGPGQVETTTYGAWAERTRRLGGALDALGVSADGRVGTFCWNTTRHLELYFAVPCSGRVLHTINIRLFDEQITYIANHAADEVIFCDRSLLHLLWSLIDTMPGVRHVVVIDDGEGDIPSDERIVDYESLIADAEPHAFAVVTDENQAASMCYTSGTTGNPKGVVYSHRSIMLHAMCAMMVDTLGVSESDRILPVVPMFHANAWGLCQAGVFAGSEIVFPGRDLSAEAIAELVVGQRSTLAGGVPTVWMGVRPLLEGRDLSHLRAILCGGSAVPKAMAESYRTGFGVEVRQAWGMTETSPIASIARVRSDRTDRSDDEQANLRATAGMPAPGVDLRIADADDEAAQALPWDGEARGEIQVRGPWCAADYYDDPRSGESFTADGWLRTGDVATVSPDGYIRLVDRTKDVIKSGGEWISSLDLENELMAHPAIAEAAVVAIPHEKWQERPLACVVLKPDQHLTKEDVLEFLQTRVAKWWLPDDVVFIDEVPRTSVGKFSKKELRDRFAGQYPKAAAE
ncbi:MAG: long-chain fatty acid--CoA ligase [Actinomycetota bacterium]|nr:long-chain fatty acid--CoA ligase [Actinomycetota bacterium]